MIISNDKNMFNDSFKGTVGFQIRNNLQNTAFLFLT